MQELSQKEVEILSYAAKGLNNKEISKVIFITDHTVKAHMTSVYKKLGVANRAAAVYVAVKNNLID